MLHLFFFGRSFKTHDGVSLSSYFLISSFSSFYFFFWFLFFSCPLVKRPHAPTLGVPEHFFFCCCRVCAPHFVRISLRSFLLNTFWRLDAIGISSFFLAPEDFVCDSHLKPFPGHLFYDPMVSPRHQPLRGGVCVGALEK